MQSKTCFKCGAEKPLNEFYKHPTMADGHLNKCKECNKADVIANRAKNVEHYRAYDRKRGGRQAKEYGQMRRKKYPNKFKATSMVACAIRSKKLFKESCQVCGSEEKIHAHHDDYLKPLNVRWLCSAHHSQWHVKHGAGKNG